MIRRLLLVVPLTLLGLFTSAACAETPPATQMAQDRPHRQSSPAFDPNQYIRVSEIKPGMTGYGLTVFKGAAIERFDVTVVSVLKNFNPKYDVVLIRCHGDYLEHTGSIAGMSGSPIFIHDEQGRDRLLGAFAYGWPLAKDPLAGVQPIQYMLNIDDNPAPIPPGDGNAQASGDAGKAWSLLDCKSFENWLKTERGTAPAARPLAGGNGPLHLTGGSDLPRLQPLATPLMMSGISPEVMRLIEPKLRACGLVPMEAGASSSPPATAPSTQPIKFERGSVLAVPLVTGDADMTAIGTVTEVIGDRVYGFGHPFNNEGSIALPMATGSINGVVANLSTSFKLGSPDQIHGTLLADQTVGVAGITGTPPPMIPVTLKVHSHQPDSEQEYHFQIVQHRVFTPLAAMATVTIALSGNRNLPQYHTVNYDLDLTFSDGRVVKLHNTEVNDALSKIAAQLGIPLEAAADNPFERVPLKEISGTIDVIPEAREARILAVTCPRLKYRPGETVKLYVNFRPFRGAEATMPITFELPRDLPNGTFPLLVTDYATYLEAEKLARPFRFTAETAGEMFAVLDDILPLPHNALYVQLMRQQDGVAIGHTAMPHLPASHRQVLMDAGISDTTPFVSSNLKIVPTQDVMSGAAQFDITIDRQAKVETGSTPGGTTAKPAIPATPQPPASQPGH